MIPRAAAAILPRRGKCRSAAAIHQRSFLDLGADHARGRGGRRHTVRGVERLVAPVMRHPQRRRGTRSRRGRGRSATSARPAASASARRSKAPSWPLRLSIACTSAASRVPGTTGLPCSRQPWWARMTCSSARASSAREAGDRLDLAAHAVVAERDLALELAGVGQVGAAVLAGVGLELADVVQQRAADGEVAVDARRTRRRPR